MPADAEVNRLIAVLIDVCAGRLAYESCDHEHGYSTAVAFFRKDARRYRRLFAKHGIAMTDPALLPDVPPRHPHRSSLARTLDSTLDRLESRLGARRA